MCRSTSGVIVQELEDRSSANRLVESRRRVLRAAYGAQAIQAETTVGILHSITEKTLTPLREIKTDAPPMVQQILRRALEKFAASGYQSAGEVVRDASDLLASIDTGVAGAGDEGKSIQCILLCAAVAILFVVAGSLWFHRGLSDRRWLAKSRLH